MRSSPDFQVTLTAEEMNEAAEVAKRLHDQLRKQGVKDGHGLKNATAEMEAGGAQSELAVARFYGVEWTAGKTDDKYGPDVGKRTQVRSSQKPRSHHHLIVREKDILKYQDVPFVLVIQSGRQFEIKGWIMAFDAVRLGRLWDGGDDSRPPAYFVPEGLLHSPETLDSV